MTNEETVQTGASSGSVVVAEYSDDEGSVKSHPLLIYLVLTNILKYLDLEDLKRCRLVCKAWDEEASNMITQMSEVRLYCARKTMEVKEGSKSIASFAEFLHKYRINCRTNPFMVKNFTISHLGQEEQTWGRWAGFGWTTYSIVARLRSTVETLNLDNVCTSKCNEVTDQVILGFPHLQSLKITFYDDEHNHDYSFYSYNYLMANELPKYYRKPLAHLKVVHIENSFGGCRLPVQWKFWRLCQQIVELRLKDKYESLFFWMSSLIVFRNNLPLERLDIIAVGWAFNNEGRDSMREFLVTEIRKFIRKLHLKKLTLDLDLSLDQWSTLLAGNLPDSLTRLCIRSDFSGGSNHPADQFMEGDTTDRILAILGPSLPATLDELAFYFKGVQGMDGTVKIHSGTLRFDGVRDLTWVCERQDSPSSVSWWESLLRNGLQDLASIFPNVRRLETTVGTKKALRQLLTGFPNLEELVLSQWSRLKLSDIDVTGNQQVGSRRRRRRKAKNLGFPTLKKLRSLTLESDCRRVTDLSIQDGFLKMPALRVLQISQGPVFGSEAMQALNESLDRLSIRHK